MFQILSNKTLRCSNELKVTGLLLAIFFCRPTNQLFADQVLDNALSDLNSAEVFFKAQIVEASETIADELQRQVIDLVKQERIDDAVATRDALRLFREQGQLPQAELFLPIKKKAASLIQPAIAVLKEEYSKKVEEFTVAG